MLTPRKHLTKKELHKDPVLEKISKTTDFFQANQTNVLYAVLGVVALGLVIYFYNNYRNERTTESIDKLSPAERIYFSGDYREAIRKLEKYCENYEGTVGGGMGTYYLANSYFNTDQYDFAMKHFQTYVDDYGDNELFTISSMTGIAACYEGLNKYDEAIKQYEKVVSKFSDSPYRADAMMSIARCYRMTNQPDNAKTWLARIVKDFPDSAPAREAKVALDELGGA